MKRERVGTTDLYVFDLPGAIAVLRADRPKGRKTSTLHLMAGGETRPPGPRPSDLGAEGFDDLWGPGQAQAHRVPEDRLRALVRALRRLEAVPVP